MISHENVTPQSPEFWTRCRQYEHLQAERQDDGAWSWAWVPPSGRRYGLPDPKSVGMEAFWTALDKAEEAEEDEIAGRNKTFKSLIAEYKGHAVYNDKLSEKTKIDYDRYLDVIESAWGTELVANLTTVDAQEAIDAYQDTPSSGRYFRSVLSRLVAFGIPRGYSTTNPVEHTEKPDHDSEPYKPWPDWAFELFFRHARIGLHLPVYSALFTGQRKVDVIGMSRPRKEDDAVELIARKTKKRVWVPIHPEYRQVIDATRPGADEVVSIAEHQRLHISEAGEPWTYEGFNTAWQREMTFGFRSQRKEKPSPEEMEALLTPEGREKRAAMKRIRDEGLVFHGFRKNAVNMLLEVGCTEAQVAAIVEMSEQMVRHYSKDVDKRRLAVAGMKKLEEGWKETRQSLFGGTVHRIGGNGS